MSGRLNGKTALVTGGSSGIGLATARLFAAEGASVVLNGRDGAKIEATVAELGPAATGLAADVGCINEAEELVTRAIEALGRIDILVNAAGIVEPRPLSDLSAELFAEHMAVNLTGSYTVARAVGLHMKTEGCGAIVNVGSELSHFGMPFYVHYCASKAGVLGLTRAMAAELAPEVTVNAICPGPVDTPMLEAEIQYFGGTDDIRKEAWDRVPMKRLAQPDEVAAAILFLATDAPFATGSAMALDGGTTAI